MLYSTYLHAAPIRVNPSKGNTTSTKSKTGKKIISLAVVPHMDSGDKVENNMYKLMGQLPGIDHVIVVSTPKEFFNKLREYERKGFLIDNMIIAGHGSAGSPSIEFGSDTLTTDMVDLKTKETELQKKSAAINKKRALGQSISQRYLDGVKQLNQEIQELKSISKVMTPNASVKLINCSTAATQIGREFVYNLGTILMGKNGGSITASKTDVSVDQTKSYLQAAYVSAKTGKLQERGNFFAMGKWTTIKIPPNQPAKTANQPKNTAKLLIGTWSGKCWLTSKPNKKYPFTAIIRQDKNGNFHFNDKSQSNKFSPQTTKIQVSSGKVTIIAPWKRNKKDWYGTYNMTVNVSSPDVMTGNEPHMHGDDGKREYIYKLYRQ